MKNWIKEFEKEFPQLFDCGGKWGNKPILLNEVTDKVIKFIKSLLLTQHKERMERLEGMKKKIDIHLSAKALSKGILDANIAFNLALEKVIQSEQSLYGGEEL